MTYCSVSDVKTYLGIEDDEDDLLIGALIDRAQAAIDAYKGRSYESPSDTTLYFDAVADVDGSVLLFGAHVAATISAIKNGDGTTVSSGQYVTLPRNHGPFFGVKLLASSGVAWTYEDDPEGAIEITGRWGASVTPDANIVQATIRLTAYLYKQRDMINQGTDSERVADGVVIRPGKIPADVLALLGPGRLI